MKNVIKSDVYRLMGTFLPWLTILLFVLSRLGVALPEYVALFQQSTTDVNYAQSSGYLYYSSFFLSSAVNFFAVSVTCIPFGMAYLEDRKNGFDRYFISRTNISHYSFSKYLVNLLASFLTAFLAYFVTVLIFIFLCRGIPGALMVGDGSTFLQKLSIDKPGLYIFLLSFFSSLYCAMWSCIVLLLSAFFDSIYIVFAITYAGVVFTQRLQLAKIGWPMFSNAAMRGAWLSVDGMPAAFAILLNLLQYSLLFCIIFLLFKKQVKRNYERS